MPMRAIAVKQWGGRDKLELVDVEPPPVAPDGVLLRVRAAALNPIDAKVREGKLAGAFPFHFPVILGWDAAGVVERVGPAVTWFKPGDSAYGYCRRQDLQYGTYAEYVTAPEGHLAHMPPELSFEAAAALPLASLTAHQGLETIGLRVGEYLFVTGGAGGVGHCAIQLARARGARAIASGSQASHDFIRELGAEPVDHADPGLPERVRELAGDGGIDAAFDLFGGDGQQQAFSVLRRGGRLVSIAAPPQPREHIESRYMFARQSGYDLGEHITPLVDEGSLRPHISGTYPLESAAEAMERLEAGHVRGKLVLTIA
jgi:NADPH:quinone reductase-like Zn-dependent oxidoreductase